MRQQKVIWGALFFSTVIYVGLAYSFAPNPELPFSDAVAQTTALMFYGVAFATFIAAMVIPSLLVNLPPQTKMIVALSMFEACSIMGLLAAFLLKDWRLIVPAWIASLVGFMREYPRDEVSAPVERSASRG